MFSKEKKKFLDGGTPHATGARPGSSRLFFRRARSDNSGIQSGFAFWGVPELAFLTLQIEQVTV